MPSLVELQALYESKGLAIIAIDVGEDAEVMREFIEQNGVNYLNLLGDTDVTQAFRVKAHPLTVFITPQGAIHEQYLGWREKQELEEGIWRLFALSDP